MNALPINTSRFNFTLRESLLAMVAIGALLALAVKSYEKAQPFVPTGLFESLDAAKVKTIVAAIGRQLEVEMDQTGAGEGESSGGNSASREIRLNVRVPSETFAEIVVGLQAEIKKMLSEDGCRIVSSGGASAGGKTNLTQFSFDYEKENTRGHVFAHRVPTSSGTLNLYILIHEFRQ